MTDIASIDLHSYYQNALKHIQSLGDGWNDGYDGPYSPRMCDRVIHYLQTMQEKYIAKYHEVFPLPYLIAGMGSDIDIEWNLPHFRLLITLPNDDSQPAGLYGTKETGTVKEIQRSFPADVVEDELITWWKL